MGDLKIRLIAQFKQLVDTDILKQKVEQFIVLNPDFKIESIEFVEYAKRPAEEMMIDVLLDLAKKLEDLKTLNKQSQ